MMTTVSIIFIETVCSEMKQKVLNGQFLQVLLLILDVGVDENYPTKSEARTSVTAVLRLLQEMSKTPSLRQNILLSLKQQVCFLVTYVYMKDGIHADREIEPQMNEKVVFK
jgi:hypothetical protein